MQWHVFILLAEQVPQEGVGSGADSSCRRDHCDDCHRDPAEEIACGACHVMTAWYVLDCISDILCVCLVRSRISVKFPLSTEEEHECFHGDYKRENGSEGRVLVYVQLQVVVEYMMMVVKGNIAASVFHVANYCWEELVTRSNQIIQSSFYRKLQSTSLNITSCKSLPGTEGPNMPYVLAIRHFSSRGMFNIPSNSVPAMSLLRQSTARVHWPIFSTVLEDAWCHCGASTFLWGTAAKTSHSVNVQYRSGATAT
ncbi:hypothetical protein PR048_027249 [Dryococelus australis]|uniref:Uncharacterized protein n=1 Tax=Dryococelus australis TaxID=614101 RepID=A0ABQ9GFE7_9NEOP|nr:hypothetical protein PR048_027249 [Dryococelus australis]